MRPRLSLSLKIDEVIVQSLFASVGSACTEFSGRSSRATAGDGKQVPQGMGCISGIFDEFELCAHAASEGEPPNLDFLPPIPGLPAAEISFADTGSSHHLG